MITATPAAPAATPRRALDERDLSDLTEAIAAWLRMSGYKNDHSDLFNAAIAAAYAAGSTKFRASRAEFGARLVNEPQPFRSNLDDSEALQRRKNLEQKFDRAFAALKVDQLATGLWFLEKSSGGQSQSGRKLPCFYRVAVDAITRTAGLAKSDPNYEGQFRIRAFERAAEKVIAAMPRKRHDPMAALKTQPTAREALAQAKKSADSAVERGNKALVCFVHAEITKGTPRDEAIALWFDAQGKYAKESLPAVLTEETLTRKRYAPEATPPSQDELLANLDAHSPAQPTFSSEGYTILDHLPTELKVGETSPLGASAPYPAARSRLENDDSLHGYICLSQDQGNSPPSDLLTDRIEDQEKREIDVVSPTVSRELPPTARADAAAMLEAFESVGIDRFHVLLRDSGGNKASPRGWFESQTKAQTLFHLERAERDQLRLEIRWPKLVGGVSVIQLDDITASTVRSLKSISLCVIETSLENFQAFVAVGGVKGEAQRDSLRRRMILGALADKGATGSSKLAGSLNAKETRRRPDGTFPRVGLVAVNPGSLVATDELELAGLPDDPRPTPPPPMMVRPPLPRRANRAPKREPSYQISLNCGPMRADGSGKDRSIADFIHAGTCLKIYGFSIQETEDILKRVSDHAREKESDPATYIRDTVRNADTRATSPYLSQ